MSDGVEVDPVFAALERYGSACETFEEDATGAALEALVYLEPTTKAGRAAKRKYFTLKGADGEPVNLLPYVRRAIDAQHDHSHQSAPRATAPLLTPAKQSD